MCTKTPGAVGSKLRARRGAVPLPADGDSRSIAAVQRPLAVVDGNPVRQVPVARQAVAAAADGRVAGKAAGSQVKTPSAIVLEDLIANTGDLTLTARLGARAAGHLARGV